MAIVFINVELKTQIHDPQGEAILGALSRQGLSQVIEVRQGKRLKLTLKNDVTKDELSRIENLAQSLLSNPVIEDYSIEVKNES